MILATSQEVTSITIASGGSGSGKENNMIDYTFDTNYISGTAGVGFDIDLDVQNTTYIAIAGHNLGTLGCLIRIKNHDELDVVGINPTDDRPIMIAIPARNGGVIDAVRIEITKQNATDVVVISHVASGLTTDFTSVTSNSQILVKDYQSGYPRIPMNLGRKSKATLNESAAPTATLIKTVSQRVKLNIDNVATEFARVDLLGFQRFWVENSFFIQTDDDVTQSYMAMQFVPSAPKSHSQTRELVNLSYSFVAYNGL